MTSVPVFAGVLGLVAILGSGGLPALAAEADRSRPPGPGPLTVTLVALADSREAADGAPASGDSCTMTVSVRHGGSVRVETFSLRLVLFDRSGVVLRQVSVLAMPLVPGQATHATFPADDVRCDRIGAVNLRDFPLCADAAGAPLDCGADLTVRSTAGVPFGA